MAPPGIVRVKDRGQPLTWDITRGRWADGRRKRRTPGESSAIQLWGAVQDSKSGIVLTMSER